MSEKNAHYDISLITSASVDRVVLQLERIAIALERLANLKNEPKPTEAAELKRGPVDWVLMAERAIAGESVKSIAVSIGRKQPSTRKRILKVFELRNPSKYQELKSSGDWGCLVEPSMRVLITNASAFGFLSTKPDFKD